MFGQNAGGAPWEQQTSPDAGVLGPTALHRRARALAGTGSQMIDVGSKRGLSVAGMRVQIGPLNWTKALLHVRVGACRNEQMDLCPVGGAPRVCVTSGLPLE